MTSDLNQAVNVLDLLLQIFSLFSLASLGLCIAIVHRATSQRRS